MNARQAKPNERPNAKKVKFRFKDRMRTGETIDKSLDATFGEIPRAKVGWTNLTRWR